MEEPLRSFVKLSLKLWSGLLEGSDTVGQVQKELHQAGLHVTAEEYLSSAISVGILAPLFIDPIFLLAGLAMGFPFIAVIVPVVLLSFVMVLAVILLFLVYPSILAGELKQSVTQSLPFASVYLSTLAGTGMSPSKMFEVLAKFKEYGEISTESRAISSDTNLVGMDITTALKRAAERTPSPDLKDLFLGMRNAILNGGDIKVFLIEKSKTYMQSYRRNLDSFVNTLSLYTEMYITVVIVGSIFFIVMSTIMSMIGGSTTSIVLMQNLVIYFALPMVSVMFMVLVSSMSP